MSDWWHDVERLLDDADDDAPDPWGHLVAEAEPLTAAQRSFLEQLASQPVTARLSDADDASGVE